VPSSLVAKANLLSSRGASGTNPELVEFVTEGKAFKRVFVQRKDVYAPTSQIAHEVAKARKALVTAVGEERTAQLLAERGFDNESLVNQKGILEALLGVAP
jgi:hypothetical protein